MGYECERHEIRLFDSDDSMTRIKLVNFMNSLRDLGSNAALCLLEEEAFFVAASLNSKVLVIRFAFHL